MMRYTAQPLVCAVCDKPIQLGVPGQNDCSSIWDHRVGVTVLLCPACIEQTTRFLARLRLRENQYQQAETIQKRLEAIGAGRMLTVIDSEPRALPNALVQRMYEGTDYGRIWE